MDLLTQQGCTPHSDDTEDKLSTLRRELEGRIQDVERHVAEVRQRVRAIEAGGAMVPPAIAAAAEVNPGAGRNGSIAPGWFLSGVRRGVARLEVRRRLHAAGRWFAHVWRAAREGPGHA
jgi:hypothetical protein